MSDAAGQIFSKFDIRDVSIRNRLAVAPMTRVTAMEDGLATPRMSDYYKRFADGGFGLVITEGLYTDQLFSQGNAFQPGMSSAEQSASWRPIVKDLQGRGTKVFAQLMHAGALVQGNRFMSGAVAPSALQPRGEQMTSYRGEGPFPVPSEISDEQLADAIAGFGTASEAAFSAGFDGVEIHGANGYLLDQFLTDYTNHRTDKWGGDIKARMGVILDVVSTVKSSVGGKGPVGIRISQGKVNDFYHKWEGGERDAEVIFGSLADAGIDFLHVTEFIATKPAFDGTDQSLTKLARKFAPNVPLIANGSAHSVDDVSAILDQGADMVAIGRSALANPDWPARVKNGKEIRTFDPSILQPIAHVKDSELEIA
ncbi:MULTISPECIES: NADH:flavin oxidoreductase [Agrobacterium]|uniref:NADH:flavin oxidoreductase n=1 Tax=Agrobacterium rubi TaxID=28099 RepID=A0AAE7R8S2_9HYPH|nr:MULTISPECIES: NADH:flavin oxidoreductase [Agrobacterium]MBN7807849.1 NADH:flavin oxidoreductase [Agrobacterium rosae]NTE89809.1 NADH:flavin oxidoreductase [Agrobacterium rubi]NTF05341.1 NADH:flavin oxidoreductase [Agrobacterium rubi]NTF10504.1 NADH:flavin oxidoreductase [Agrobacterium rubi]NTF22898.1 NADH:flavin oxidoreductase [Agrobacterium rubi]